MPCQVNKWVAKLRLFALGLLLTPLSASGQTVGCAGAGPGPFDFSTLQAAVNSVSLEGPSTITVSGTCTEFVFIDDRERLTIVGTPGAELRAAQLGTCCTVALFFIDARDVTIADLTISGPGKSVSDSFLVLMQDSLDVTFRRSTVQDAVVGIIFLNGPSTLRLEDSTIQRTQVGVLAGLESVTVRSSVFQENDVAIQIGNGRLEIGARRGSFSVFENGLRAINAFSSVVGVGRTQIRGQTFGGIVVFEGTLRIGSDTIIEDNGLLGVALIGSNGRITGNTVIQRNGDAADPLAGIFVRGSHLELRGGANQNQILNNQGDGVQLQDNSSAVISRSTITGNTGRGVRVVNLSSAQFRAPNTISGNTGASIFCGPRSLASGDFSGASRPIQCGAQGIGTHFLEMEPRKPPTPPRRP